MRLAVLAFALTMLGGCCKGKSGTSPVGDWICEGKPTEFAQISASGRSYTWRDNKSIYTGQFDGKTLQMGVGLSAFAAMYDRENDKLMCVAGCDCAEYVRGQPKGDQSAEKKAEMGKLILEQLPEPERTMYCRLVLGGTIGDRYYTRSNVYTTGGPRLKPCATKLAAKNFIMRLSDKREDPTAAPYRFQVLVEKHRTFSLIRGRTYLLARETRTDRFV